jgi:hypothetical protein
MKRKLAQVVFSIHEDDDGFRLKRSDFDENHKLLNVTEFEAVYESKRHAREEIDQLMQIAYENALDREEETGDEAPEIFCEEDDGEEEEGIGRWCIE